MVTLAEAPRPMADLAGSARIWLMRLRRLFDVGNDRIEPEAYTFQRWGVMGRWVRVFGRYEKENLRLSL